MIMLFVLQMKKYGSVMQLGIQKMQMEWQTMYFVVVVVLLFYVHGKHLRSCWDGQLT